MLTSDLVLASEHFLAMYRELFLIDPFFRIRIDVIDGDWISKCQTDNVALSWVVILNPNRHEGPDDVKHSIIDGLLRVMFTEVDRASKRDEGYVEMREGVIVRLATVFGNLLPDNINEVDEETDSAEELG